MDKATVDAPGVITSLLQRPYKHELYPFGRVFVYIGLLWWRLFISVWALTLSVQHNWAMREPQEVERTTDVSTLSFMLCTRVKFLARYHHDMDIYCATSDVKGNGVGMQLPPNVGFTSNVLPETEAIMVESLQTGVSTSSVSQQKGSKKSTKPSDETFHWYVLRTTYGREKKAYDYLVAHGAIAFFPTLRSVKLIDGKRLIVEESRIPNIFFAYGTEEELKSFVYDNVNLPYLRFYYCKTRIGNRTVNVPLIVPQKQMDSLQIICAANADDIIVTSGEVAKFREGQTVRVTEGEFKGVTGKVARYKNHQRVGIILDGLITVCTAYIPSAFIDIIDDR